MKEPYYINSPIGLLCIEEENGFVVGLHVDNHAKASSHTPSPLQREAIRQLQEYFDGVRTSFQLPILPTGTPFQKKVWSALQEISYGKTCSYKDIAQAINQPTATRAVGGANNKNPILILIPCHRVIGANGSLVGFGCGLEVKQYLLDLEKNHG